MSSLGANGPPDPGGPEMDRLESAVDRIIAEVSATRQRLEKARERTNRSDELLRDFVDGTLDPGALSRRLAELEAENENLRLRIQQGREGIDQILAKIRFLEHRR